MSANETESKFIEMFVRGISDARICVTLDISLNEGIALAAGLRARLGVKPNQSLRAVLKAVRK